MVGLEHPSNDSISPPEDIPQLTINHDVAADLDSSNAFEGPEKLLEVWFAPSADALPAGVKPDGLKAVPADVWVPMLDEVHCKVLSVVNSEHIDAYLLSESSMFVFPHKLILKTCGTTTLLWGLKRLLRIAAREAGFPFHNVESLDDEQVAATPYRVFYSRKNFLYPEKQPLPHRSWGQEIKFLDDMFDHGSAYMVGKMNGDHWYLYITSPQANLTPPRTPDEERTPTTRTRHRKIPTGLASAFDGTAESNDETLEILMTDLDAENAKQFYLERASAVACAKLPVQVEEARHNAADSLGDLSGSTCTIQTNSTAESLPDETFDEASLTSESDRPGANTPMSEIDPVSLTTEGHALGTVVSDCCGLSDVYPTCKYPDARIDAYMFNPCGFSANGVIPAPPKDGGNKSTHYFTVHVTPEPQCSYASFETNVPGGQNGRETSEVIEQVVGIFKPGHFSITLFEAKDTNGDTAIGTGRSKRVEKIRGYRRIDRIVHDFEDYELVFRYYEREGWVGGTGVRVGEEM
ncbi:putative adenosylmethionine decarboxylase [Seiridium unicorne]|uniref:adenosylmethionine decarboxylase n=1 Tax=Seiridium unicorne TaxID=138068 RepID=A0ABR2UN22_9PEZI